MVVCKCRKATKLYCFVHRTPLCLDCICSPDHDHCVVAQYSDWVNDGDYDWPPLCPVCGVSLEDTDQPTVRLGCLHVSHSSCLQRHLESFPAHTAPAGYSCPAPGCSAAVWPPKSQKDASSTLYTNLRAVVAGSGVSDALLMAPIPTAGLATPPVPSREQSANDLTSFGAGSQSDRFQKPAYAQQPEIVPANGEDTTPKADGVVPSQQLSHKQSPSQSTRSGSALTSRAGSASQAGAPAAVAVDIEEDLNKGGGHGYASDFESGDLKYVRRGAPHAQLLRALGLGFLWGPPGKGLPVTHSKAKDKEDHGDDVADARPRRARKGGALDPRKLLLGLAIGSCMATMLLLYYRLAQGGLTEGILP